MKNRQMNGLGIYVYKSGMFQYGYWEDGIKLRDIHEEEMELLIDKIETIECVKIITCPS